MALNRFLVAEMVEVSEPWVTEGNAANGAILGVPLLAPLLTRLKAVHAALFALRPKTEDPKLQRLGEQGNALDAKHDELVQAIYGALTAVAKLSSGSDDLLKVRDRLLPDGLSHINRSHRAEAGHTKLAGSMLSAADREALKAVTLRDKTMMDLVDQWLAVGKELGEIEASRAQLLSSSDSPSAAEVNAARLAWIRTVNAFRAMAEMSGLDEQTDRLLFSALRIVEKAAARRGKSAEVIVDPAPAPVPPPAEDRLEPKPL